MKKRISQVVSRQFILTIITVVLSANLLAGCAQNETPNASEEVITTQESTDKVEESSAEISTTSQETQTSNVESETRSDDEIKVQEITEKVFAAYFKGDAAAIEPYILDTAEDVFEPHSTAGEDTPIPEYKIKGLANVNDMNLDDLCEISCEFTAAPTDDYFQYLTITFIKKDDGWKVQSIGLEL